MMEYSSAISLLKLWINLAGILMLLENILMKNMLLLYLKMKKSSRFKMHQNSNRVNLSRDNQVMLNSLLLLQHRVLRLFVRIRSKKISWVVLLLLRHLDYAKNHHLNRKKTDLTNVCVKNL